MKFLESGAKKEVELDDVEGFISGTTLFVRRNIAVKDCAGGTGVPWSAFCTESGWQYIGMKRVETFFERRSRTFFKGDTLTVQF